MQKGQAGAIEITPEMVTAGASALLASGLRDFVSSESHARAISIEVFRAMMGIPAPLSSYADDPLVWPKTDACHQIA